MALVDSVHPVPCAGVSHHLVISQPHRGHGKPDVGAWSIGDGVWLMRMHYRGVAVSCRRTRRSAPTSRILTLGLVNPGDWTFATPSRTVAGRHDRPGLVALDQSSVFDFRGHGYGSVIAVHVLHARVTLSIETVHHALGNVHPDLPLYPLVLRHLQQLGSLAHSAPEMLSTTSSATVDLVRSLLISAADSARTAGDTSDLARVVERYIDTHLDDPSLAADSIAAAHNISVRQLYKLWPETNGSLAGFITGRRLERARTALLAHPRASIATIALHHGFIHPTHFAQRFRAVYGLTPSKWRRDNQIRADASYG